MSKHSLFFVAAIVAAAGCGKKKEGGDPKADPGAAPKGADPGGAADPAPAESGPWVGWGMSERVKAWQGAWSGDGSAIGSKAAWSIDGATAQYVEGGAEKKLAFAVTSPCSAKFTEKGADGSESSTTTVFTLEHGQLITGLGDAGTRKGKNAVVCGAGAIFELDGATCTEWHDDFGKLASSPGECGIRQEGGKDVFFYKAMGTETVLAIDGDVIWSDQLKSTHAARQPDLAAAKKAQGL